MPGNTKKAILSGYYGFDNFGDEAILGVLSENLKKNGIDVCVISKNPQKTAKKLETDTVYTFDICGIIKKIRTSDVLISGGGSLLQDTTSLKSLFYYLFIIFCAQFFRKKVIIFAQGIGPIKNIAGRIITKLLLKNCCYVTVRDEKSLFLLRGWGITTKLVNDPVWNIEVKEPVKMNRVGVQLRGWKNLSGKFLFALAHNIAKEFSDREIYIYSFQDALDLDVCRQFEGNLKIVNPSVKTKIIDASDTNLTISSVSNLEYMIAMRYHACLVALKYGIKTMALCYDEKVSKLSKRFHIPCSMLDDSDRLPEMFAELKSLDTKKILSETKDLRFDFSEIISLIKNRIP